MTTNAMLLDKYIDYLVDKKFQLLISLDGTAINHSYRVDHINRNSFHQVVKNIKLLRQKYPDYFNTNVNFNAVLHNRNSVAETFNFIKNEFGKKPNITELNTTGIRMEKRDLFWESYRNKKESLHQAKNFKDIEKEMFMDSPSIRELCLFLHQYSGNVFRTYNDIIISKKEKEVLPTGTCMPFERKMYVTVNGKILPCERIGHQFSLGNVTDTEVFLDIENIAHRYNSWFQKLSAQCTQCFNTQACIQCMFFIDNLDDKPVCRGFMSEKAFHKYVSAQFSYLKEHPYLYKEIMEDIILQ